MLTNARSTPAGRRRPRGAVVVLVVLAFMLPAGAQEDRPDPGDGTRAVTRIAGEDRVGTAIALARAGWPQGAATVVLATAVDFPDALAAAPLAADLDAPVLLTPPRELPVAVAAELERLQAAEVVVLGGPAAVGTAVEEALREDGYGVERLGGEDRYATAALVARRAGAPVGVYAIASGEGFADALAAGALAATSQRPPVLLVQRDAVPEATSSALRALADDGVGARYGDVLGGTTAVSDEVLAQLPGSVGRLAGPTRYATAEAVAGAALALLGPGPRPLLVASADAFPDALVAGALAARLGAVLALVPPTGLTDGMAALLLRERARFDRVLVAGGPGSVADRVVEQLGRVVNGQARDVPPTWTPQPAAAVEYAATRSGAVSFAAIGTDGVLVGHQEATTVAVASVVKVMFLVAYLRQPDVRDRDLTDADRRLLEPMIRESANGPATTIADRLGPGPLNALAAEAGMQDFAFTRPWGLSRTSARDQAPFLLAVDTYLPERHRAYALQLLDRGRALPALGHRRRSPHPTGPPTSRAAGAPVPARSTTRSCSWSTAPAPASRSPS